MTARLRRHFRATRLATLAVCLLATIALACGGGDGDNGGDDAARNPTDPRRVPTATIPAAPSTPLAALEGGQTADRPALPESYVVKSGDTLGSIATDLGITTDDLVRANPNIDPRGLRIGQELRIPRATPTPNPASRATPSPAAGTRSPSPSPPATPARTPAPGASPAPAGSPTPAASPTGTRTATPSPAASPAPGGSPAAGASTYTVQSGDTGCAIARRFMVSVQQLAAANGLTVEALASLRVGQMLQIPRSTGADPGC
jgi:LysM repeat protein